MSIGVTVVGTTDLALDNRTWFERADKALYVAKSNGRNRAELTPAPVAAQDTEPGAGP